MNQKSVIILLAILMVFSVSANVYSFNTLSNEESEINKRNAAVLENREKEISELRKEVESLSTQNKESKTEEITLENSEDQENTETENEQIEIKKISELENAAERFIDYTFNVNEENYATVKSNAENYMTKEMVETLFSSDGLDDAEINLTTTVDKVDVYTANEDSEQAIVHYEIELDYGNGYKEKLKPFVLLYFVIEDGKLKVSKLQAINDIGGI